MKALVAYGEAITERIVRVERGYTSAYCCVQYGGKRGHSARLFRIHQSHAADIVPGFRFEFFGKIMLSSNGKSAWYQIGESQGLVVPADDPNKGQILAAYILSALPKIK